VTRQRIGGQVPWQEWVELRWQDYIWCRDLTVLLCHWCRGPLPARRRNSCSSTCRQAFDENHFWWAAAPAAIKRAGGLCEDCGLPSVARADLEVHHLVPVDGVTDLRTHSCYNHQANLRVLCHACHVRTRWSGARCRREVERDLQGVML
jgi:hypothetical protein